MAYRGRYVYEVELGSDVYAAQPVYLVDPTVVGYYSATPVEVIDPDVLGYYAGSPVYVTDDPELGMWVYVVTDPADTTGVTTGTLGLVSGQFLNAWAFRNGEMARGLSLGRPEVSSTPNDRTSLANWFLKGT